MATFFTPPGNSGSAELTVANGLTVVEQNSWKFSQSGYNDGRSFGASLTGPERADPGAPVATASAGLLSLRAQNWSIAVVGNQLTDYVGPDSTFYPADRCRIQITGHWSVTRQINTNSFNSTGVIYSGRTETDEGDRDVGPFLLSLVTTPLVSYRIQGASVQGGAEDTFSSHVFYCRVTESATTENSNKEFQSNSLVTPIWQYTFNKSWQID